MGQQIIYNNLEIKGALTVNGTQVVGGGGGGGISNTAAISGGNAEGLYNEIGTYATQNMIGAGAVYNSFGNNATTNYYGAFSNNNYFGSGSNTNKYFGGYGYGEFNFDTNIKVQTASTVLTTGNQDISGTKNFASIPTVNGISLAPIIAPLENITAPTKTFVNSDSAKIFHVSGTAPCTLTLPSYSSASNGWTVGVVNVGGQQLIFTTGHSTNTINDVTTFSNTVKWSSLYIYKSNITNKFIAVGTLY
jgi:hypothetical protein